MTWGAARADVTNLYLERAGRVERIDHRSNAARGLDELPTIHEGVTARALEQKGIIADRCEINRQIKANNALLRALKAAARKLANFLFFIAIPSFWNDCTCAAQLLSL